MQTAKLVEGKGVLAGARVVRDGYQVMLISDGGTVIRMAVDDIKRSGRATQGVIVMRLREAEQVSTLAPVVSADDETAEDDATDGLPRVSPSREVTGDRVGLDDDDDADEELELADADADEE